MTLKRTWPDRLNPDRRPRRPRSHAASGRPTTAPAVVIPGVRQDVARIQGVSVDLHAWPPGGEHDPDAFWHPSGFWALIRCEQCRPA